MRSAPPLKGELRHDKRRTASELLTDQLLPDMPAQIQTQVRRQWSHAGYDGAWNPLSPTGFLQLFIGNGDWHPLGTIGGANWDYRYASGQGTWRDTGTDRFQYEYADGKWQDNRADGWHYLGASGLSSVFLGDTDPHSLGDDFSYEYFVMGSDRSGWWRVPGDSTHVFKYNYTGATGWYYSAPDWTLWAQTTLAADIYPGGAGDPRQMMVGPDGFLYFIASDTLSGRYDLFRWDGWSVTRISNNGFTDLLYNTTTPNGAYFLATYGVTDGRVYLYDYDDSTWSYVSLYAGRYYDMHYTATIGDRVYYTAWDNNTGGYFLYQALDNGWTSVDPTKQFSSVSYAANLGDDLFYMGSPSGSNRSYVYRLYDEGALHLDQIPHSFNYLWSLDYSAKNDTNLFFRGYWGYPGQYDFFRCWNNGGIWSFADISGRSFQEADIAAHTLGNYVYFTAGSSSGRSLFWWNGTNFNLHWGGNPDLNWSTTQEDAQGYALYYTAKTYDGMWGIARVKGDSITDFSGWIFAYEPEWDKSLGTDLYWRYNTGSSADLYKWDGDIFTNVTSGYGLTQLFNSQKSGEALYFVGSTDNTYKNLYKWDGTSFGLVAGIGLNSLSNVGTAGDGVLLYNGSNSGEPRYLYGYDTNTETYLGQWSTAQVPDRNPATTFHNRDYYFSGYIGADDWELMRYWGDYAYLTGRLVR